MIRWIILSLPCLLCLWIGRNISFNEFIIKQAILINRLQNKSLLRIQILLNTKKVEILSKILIGLVALEHIYILWIEMFAWTTKGRTTFKSIPDELFGKTKGLAANQGLYNGFLAAGLIWSLLIENPYWSQNIGLFFLCCVAIAGIYGAITAQKSIFFKQALPALIAIAVLLLK